MIFYITLEYDRRHRDAVHERFKQTGAPQYEGASITDRWHSIEGNRGFLVAESSRADSIASWLQEWTELIDLEVTPVLTDEQFLDVLTLRSPRDTPEARGREQSVADALAVGAGPVGLAAAYELKRAGVVPRVLDAANEVAASWRTRREQLHLNTYHGLSHQPGMKIPVSHRHVPVPGRLHRVPGALRVVTASVKFKAPQVRHLTPITH